MTFENRNDIPLRYTWDLTQIYKNDEGFHNDVDNSTKKINQLSRFKGNLNNDTTVLECFKALSDIALPLEKASCYAYLKNSENNKDTKAQELIEKVMRVFTAFSQASAFIDPELTALPEDVIDGFIKDPRFADNSVTLRKIKMGKAHVLSAPEEEMLTGASDVARFYQETYSRLDSGDLDFGTINVDGKQVHITHGTYSVLINDSRQEVRRKAFESLYNAYEKNINTISGLYNGSVKYDCFTAKTRKFDSALSKALFYEEVDKAVYQNLIESVNANLKPLHHYMALRKEVLKLENLNMYDISVAMFEDAEIAIEFDEAFSLVKKGLEPLGKDYQNLLQTAFDNRWMDVYENKGKRSGAYSMGVTTVHPFVMLNYQKTTHNVFTIAHELGHSMHSYFSSMAQPYEKEDYTIFVAEVASTTNEVLLLHYLLKNEKDIKLRKFLLSYYLDMIRTTYYRQTMFAEFEANTHGMIEKGLPFNYESLSDKYYELNKKYYGDAVTHNDSIRYEWARIPHFYRGFYVYKYATGITCAVNIAKKILEEGEPAVKNYKKFLSTGCSLDPVSELKIAGVDLTDKKPHEVIAKEFVDTLAQLTDLCRKS